MTGIQLRRCQACKCEVKTEQELTACPACGSPLALLHVSHDIRLILNWFQLRCLVHWAGRYVHLHCQDIPDAAATLKLIEGQLGGLRPAEAPALTIREELQEAATARQQEITYVDGPSPEVIKPESVH